MNEWYGPGAVFGFIAILVSGVGLLYTRKVERRQAKLDQPTVSIDLTTTQWAGWYKMSVNIRNRTDAMWLLETVHVPHWDAARLGAWDTVMASAESHRVTTPRREDTQFEKLAVNAQILPAGANGPGALDTHFLISVEKGVGSHPVPLEVRLRSLAEIREMTIHVRRVVSA